MRSARPERRGRQTRGELRTGDTRPRAEMQGALQTLPSPSRTQNNIVNISLISVWIGEAKGSEGKGRGRVTKEATREKLRRVTGSFGVSPLPCTLLHGLCGSKIRRTS